MARTNRTRYAILGFLHHAPMSGYDIKKFTDESIRYFWQENFGHIYPVLKQMKDEGLVTASETPSEIGPSRIVYAITRKGRDSFAAWLDVEPEPEIYRKEILLKLFFTPLSTHRDTMKRHLQAELDRHESLLEEYREIESHLRGLPLVDEEKLPWLFTVMNGICTSEAQIRWCRACLDLL